VTAKKRHLRWGLPDSPVPKHPYRDTLLVYGALAVLLVLLAWATGTSVGKAIVVAAIVFVAASLLSIVRWRERLRRDARDERAFEAADRDT
jgi:Flp pilus assembly protein TadB